MTRILLPAGVLSLVLWIASLLVSVKTALLAWLVAFLAFSSVPIGCLAVLMMVVLVPGTWGQLYTRPLVRGSALLPIAAFAVIPLLLGLANLYDWTNPAITASYPSFKAAWLSPGFFIVRQLVYFAILLGIWAALVQRPLSRTAIAGAGIIAYALFDSWMGVDLTESLRPDFHSSIWGLLILSNQWLAAVAFALVVSLSSWDGAAPISAAGAFTVALLVWAYLHAMQFLVMWSGDIPAEVHWYLDRGLGGWAVATAALYLIQGFAPFFALLSHKVRASKRSMIAIGLLTLAMRPFEAAWLLLPGQNAGWFVVPLIGLALLAMIGIGIGLFYVVKKFRPEWAGTSRWGAEMRSS